MQRTTPTRVKYAYLSAFDAGVSSPLDRRSLSRCGIRRGRAGDCESGARICLLRYWHYELQGGGHTGAWRRLTNALPRVGTARSPAGLIGRDHAVFHVNVSVAVNPLFVNAPRVHSPVHSFWRAPGLGQLRLRHPYPKTTARDSQQVTVTPSWMTA